MSAIGRVLNGWLRLTEKPRMRRARGPAQLRIPFEINARIFFHGPRLPAHWEDVGGISALHLTPAQAGPATLLYFHGGGYVFGSPNTHRAMVATVAKQAGVQAVLPRYRLAPEHPFPAAFEDALQVYKAMAQTGPVILGGDSAGGGLALALLAETLRADLPKPLACFAFSPLTDLSGTAPSLQANADSEALLPIEGMQPMWQAVLAGHPQDDPRISPLQADFQGAPPVWLCASDTEILLDDTRHIAEKMRNQGVTVTEIIDHDLPHVWPIFHTLLPEARQTLSQLTNWIRSLSPPPPES